jgi:hypothetical protein
LDNQRHTKARNASGMRISTRMVLVPAPIFLEIGSDA